MKRRKFILGTGAAAAGGSALLGSGAFSRVESDRSVTVQVAEDHNAYLGLDKCAIDDEETPNSSFVERDGYGHLEIEMGDSGNDGFGVNSNSVSSFDNVFQITNQGKEAICVDLRYDPVALGREDSQKVEDAGLPLPEQSVVFYEGESREEQGSNIPNADGGNIFSPEEIDIDGPNAMPLDVGESVCVGLQTRTFGISAEDDGPENLLQDLGGGEELKIVADVGGNCDPDLATETCEIYGIDLTTDEDQAIRAITVGNDGVTEVAKAAALTDDVRDPGDENKPNGLAFDPENDLLYFSSPTPESGSLYTVELEDDDGDSITEYENFDDRDGAEISGAAFAYNGAYYYILDGDDELKRATIEDVGNEDSDVDVEGTDIELPQTVELGDIAINRDEDVVYVSSWQPSGFFKIDLEADEATDLTGEVDAEFENKQIAYGVNQFGGPQLYGTDAGTGDWYELFPETGSAQQILEDDDIVGSNQFTDLAHCDNVFSDD